MPLPRASCSAAKREREKRERESALRNAGESWPLLNPDVLIELAATLDAHSLSRFPAVCRSWRDTIADSTNALWAPLLQERFPRAFVTLKLLPAAATACYKEIYRDQLAAKQAVHRHSVCPTTCSLSDFVFTSETCSELMNLLHDFDAQTPTRTKVHLHTVDRLDAVVVDSARM